MNDPLRRLAEPLNAQSLEALLEGGECATVPIASVSLGGIRAAIDSVDPALRGSALDVALVEPLHTAMVDLTTRDAADMRVWHWLCAVAFPELVWRRWRSTGQPATDELSSALTPAMHTRFAGTGSMAGVSRNTFARIWWAAEHLGGDYELARTALARQDMYQQVFERFIGLYPPAARAAIRCFSGHAESEIREAARWLNYAAGTTVLEVLSESEIASIIEEAMPSQSD